jgi:hypothetical protein
MVNCIIGPSVKTQNLPLPPSLSLNPKTLSLLSSGGQTERKRNKPYSESLKDKKKKKKKEEGRHNLKKHHVFNEREDDRGSLVNMSHPCVVYRDRRNPWPPPR